MTSSAHYLINGESDNWLSPLDRGVAYGDGVFRTLKVNHGLPVAWAPHYQKLEQDCSALGIVCPGPDILLADIERLFTPDEEAVAKIIVTRGIGPRGYAVPPAASPTRIVIREAFPQYPSINYDQGVNLHLCQLRLSHQPRLAGIKHLNRLENVLARSEWSDPSIAEGLLLDEDGLVVACTMSNLFARFGKTVVTPVLDKCGVAGITRQRIIDNVQNMGYQPEIRQLHLDQLMQADEIIICNSLFGAWQVRSLNNRVWLPQDLASHIRTILQE
jgi:4-amino-4-deoxychorismate lyase